MNYYYTSPNDQQEDFDDLQESGNRYSAVINAADWTVQTIIQQINKGNIELNPSFQRRQAWGNKRKSQYIESLMINVPVPQVVLAEKQGARGKFIVIDGKQRLLSLRQFYSGTYDDIYTNYKLEGLTIRTDLNGKSWTDLTSDPTLEADADTLDNTTIRTAVIKNWKKETFLYTVFLRLNTGSVQLSPQELRQALHPGKFLKYVDDYSINSPLIRQVMHLKEPDARMRDAELFIRFFAFRNFISIYSGNLKQILDHTAHHFNSNWDTEEQTIRDQTVEFERCLNACVEIFGDKAFRKWNGDQYESAFNRAIFDALFLTFIDESLSKQLVDNKDLVEGLLKTLCEKDEKFKSAIEGTTKSINSIYTRINAWTKGLKSIVNSTKIPSASIEDNRIIITAK